MDSRTDKDGDGMYDDNNGKGLMYLSFLLVFAYLICNIVLSSFH
jgi:hypothetical protein